MTLPTWDLVITLFFLMAMAYGFILGRGRIVIILILTYAAYLVAAEAGGLAYGFFTGSKLAETVWISSNMTLFTTKAIIFGAIIILLSTRGEIGALTGMAKGVRSTFLVGFYSFFNAGLIISSVIKFLPESTQTELFTLSPIAAKVDSYRLWWLALPIAVMIVEGFLRGKEEAPK